MLSSITTQDSATQDITSATQDDAAAQPPAQDDTTTQSRTQKRHIIATTSDKATKHPKLTTDSKDGEAYLVQELAKYQLTVENMVGGLESLFGPMTGPMEEYKKVTQIVIEGTYDDASEISVRLDKVTAILRDALCELIGSRSEERHGSAMTEWTAASRSIVLLLQKQ